VADGPDARDFPDRKVTTTIVRELEPTSLPTGPISKLHVLVALPDLGQRLAGIFARDREWIESTIGSLPRVALRFLEPPTIEMLQWEIREKPFDIFHFVGHGDFDAEGHGTVLFQDSNGAAYPVSGEVLADTLKAQGSEASLVVLNSCHSGPLGVRGAVPLIARNATISYFLVASSLERSGIHSVVATPFPMAERAARRFSRALYHHLALGDSVETAVAAGQLATIDAREWAASLLFRRETRWRRWLQRLSAAAGPLQSFLFHSRLWWWRSGRNAPVKTEAPTPTSQADQRPEPNRSR
jgi:hypothetical protein